MGRPTTIVSLDILYRRLVRPLGKALHGSPEDTFIRRVQILHEIPDVLFQSEVTCLLYEERLVYRIMIILYLREESGYRLSLLNGFHGHQMYFHLIPQRKGHFTIDNFKRRSEERRVGKECRSRWS